MSKSGATRLLKNQFESYTNKPNGYFKAELTKEDDYFEWMIYVGGPPDTDYDGGIFKFLMTFPDVYPFKPPGLKVVSEFWHPNVYPDGKVCISILHDGTDVTSGESESERWKPIHTPESIMISVISMLADPNCSSPANVDAGVEYRNKRVAYRKRVKGLIEKAKKDLPENFKIPQPRKPINIPDTPLYSPSEDPDNFCWVIEEEGSSDEFSEESEGETEFDCESVDVDSVDVDADEFPSEEEDV